MLIIVEWDSEFFIFYFQNVKIMLPIRCGSVLNMSMHKPTKYANDQKSDAETNNDKI